MSLDRVKRAGNAARDERSGMLGKTRESELEREHTIERTCTIPTVTLARRRGSEGEGVMARYSGSSIRAPCGRKVLSAHWFLQVGTALFWHHEGCARVALRTFLF